jgi:hypothetical protein
VSAHPDFLRTEPARRWEGTDRALWEELRRDATADRGELALAWRVLPDGLVVSLRVRPENFKKEVRISASRAPADDAAAAWFDARVQEIARVFRMRLCTWYLQRDPAAPGIAVYLVELYPGEVEPGKARCRGCGQLTPWEPAYSPDGNTCRACVGTLARTAPRGRGAPALTGPSLFGGGQG